jgi:glutamate synthase (NADPH/NADH) large chain
MPKRWPCIKSSFCMTAKRLKAWLRVMGENGQEPVGSMGDDAPFAVLSERPRLIYDYFRQYFAQVTNPPIDPLREAHVMSLATSIGREMSVFFEAEGMSHRVNFKSPVLLYSDMQQLLRLPQEHYKHVVFNAVYNPAETGLKDAIERLCNEVEAAVRNGAVLLVLSDKAISKEMQPIPAPFCGRGAKTLGRHQSALRCQYDRGNRFCPQPAPFCRVNRLGRHGGVSLFGL